MHLLLFLLILPLSAFCDLYHLPGATVSVYAVKDSQSQPLLDYHSDLNLIPASCLKTLTTAAALHFLGPEFRFETKLQYDGLIDPKGTLQGNLFILGGGDPCLGSDRVEGSLSLQQQITTWANAIEAAGIKNIQGKILGDDSLWEKALAPPGWSWEDLGNYYGAGASALSFHENCYVLTLQPGSSEGCPATLLNTFPSLPSFSLQNELKTGPAHSGDQAYIYGSEYTSTHFIRGTIPASVDTFQVKGAIPDPAKCCSHLLSQELKKRGILLQDQSIPFSPRTTFHKALSPPLKEIVYWIHQRSINLYAEHLLKKMGELLYQEGSTKAGIQALKHFCHLQKIDTASFHLVDGSGLSRKNLITTKLLVETLSKVKKLPFFPLFFQTLAEQGKIRGKTGSMSFVRGYVGYLRDITFAIFINHCLDPQKMDDKIEEILQHLQRS